VRPERLVGHPTLLEVGQVAVVMIRYNRWLALTHWAEVMHVTMSVASSHES
jgi:hypothetical protein